MTGFFLGGGIGIGFWSILLSLNLKLVRSDLPRAEFRLVLPIALLLLSGLAEFSAVIGVVAAVMGYFVGKNLDQYKLNEAAKKSELRDSLLLPNLVDLLAISITAGLSPQAALQISLRKAHQDLQSNWLAVLEPEANSSFAMQLAEVARRNSKKPSGRMADQLLIGIERGTPLLPLLDAIAAETRSNNYRKLQEKAAAKDVWMMVPVVFGILPAVTAVAIYPALTTLSNI